MPASWFRQIGWDVSYGVPLVVIALAFVGYAIRDRSSRFAFAAGLLVNMVATIVVLLRLARGGGTLDAAAWITVAQVNAIVAGVVAIGVAGGDGVGAATRRRVSPRRASHSRLGETRPREPLLLVTQVALAAACAGRFWCRRPCDLAVEPGLSTWVGAADGVVGLVRRCAGDGRGRVDQRSPRREPKRRRLVRGCAGRTHRAHGHALGHRQLAGVSHAAGRLLCRGVVGAGGDRAASVD